MSIWAQRIKELRDERGWSQRELAQKVADAGTKMDGARISKIETDENPNPEIQTLSAIAEALGVTLSVLFETPRPGKEQAERGGRQEIERSPLLEERIARLDEVYPAEDSWRGDLHQAQSALADAHAAVARALRRTGATPEPADATNQAGRRAASDR